MTIDPPAGVGRTATATATVGGNGAITGINVIDPGSGYAAAPIVTITGGGLDATATAGAPSTTGSVTSVSVALPGGGYSTPAVDITGDGAGATATAYGSVDVLTLTNAGSGYTMPTLEFELPDDPDGVQATGYVVCVGDPVGGPYCNSVAPATTVDIDHVVLVEPGSGYAFAPKVSILDGTRADPIRPGGSGAEVSATIEITAVKLDTFGTGYTTANATIADTYGGTGAGAAASATVETGAITAITVGNPGSGYVTGGGVRKFIDPLPGLCNPSVAGSCPDWAGGSTTKAIPLAVADPAWSDGTNTHTEADTYVIGLVQYYSTYSSDLPPALTRGYVQIETAANAAISQHFPLVNEMLSGPPQPVMLNGSQAYAVTPPQYLGPIISATKDKPVRIVFHNLLPTGSDGDLFLPVDTTIMGSGPGPVAQPVTQDNGTVLDDARNPHCGESKTNCFSDNRATLHLHGGITPWISDGTPHQWITPAGENHAVPAGRQRGERPGHECLRSADPMTAARPSTTPTSRARASCSTTTTPGASPA